MNHTGIMPWDEDDDKSDEEYKELFPEKKRRFTFTEIRNKYRRTKWKENISMKKK